MSLDLPALAAIEKLEKEATQGEWTYTTCYGVAFIEAPGNEGVASAVQYVPRPDADLIAALRNAATTLIALAREALAAREWLEALDDANLHQTQASEYRYTVKKDAYRAIVVGPGNIGRRWIPRLNGIAPFPPSSMARLLLLW